ncbi:TPA: hypothetical protein ACXKAZ_001847 [Pseudomonas aeruginosa]
MSSPMFYAQIKHKLIKTESTQYQELMEKDSVISRLAGVAKFLINETGFKILGFVDLDAKKYFLLGKTDKFGDLIEIPISTDMLNFFKDAKGADIPIHRIKKALKREDLNKFTMEMSKFADSQMQNLEVTFL